MKKILSILLLASFLFASCAQQYVCGSKSDHRKRKAKTQKMAPTMSR